jgi:Na+/H+-dicarboxylate symporter
MVQPMESGPPTAPRVSLSTKVLIGLVLGITTGIFFGEMAGVLDIVGRAFILLLQMTVLPFMVVSLVVGLGRLDLQQAGAIARSGGAVLLVLWAIVMAVVLAFPIAFPNWESASFFSRALIEAPEPIDFLGLYIPSNPFSSLANAVVPAIVVFSVAIGIALIGVENKAGLLDILTTIQTALERITGSVVRLAPLGVLALMASAAGTLDLGELGRIQVYVLAYCAVALVLVFWLLPALVTTVTPMRHRDVIDPVRDALLTAFATGNLLIVLPILARKGKEMLRHAGLDAETADSSIDVLVPASFTLPNMGKLLSLAFVPFAGWFTGFQVYPAEYPLFAVAGLISFFGEPVVSLPFLLDLLRIPADTFDLFITVDVITSRFGTLLAATHTLVLAVLGAFVMARRITPSWRRITRFAVVSAALLAAPIGGTRLIFTYAFEAQYTTYQELVQLSLLHEPVAVRVHEAPPRPSPADAEPGRRLARIRERSSLRVGYHKDALPFAFRNAHSELVGFDIEMAHLLARELGVALELVPIERSAAAASLRRGVCDIVMSGTAVTPERTSEVRFSTLVGDLTLAFVVPDHERRRFTSWEEIRRGGNLTIATGTAGYYERLLRALIPHARLVRVASPRVFFEGEDPDLDALVTAAEAGSAWTIVYPQFSVAVPQPDPIAVPMAYPMPHEEVALADYVDAFVDLKRKDGTLHALAEHWFEGERAAVHSTRWSVIRDVLGWVE